MNIPNNKRRRESQNIIEKVFIQLIQKKQINQITVTDICKLANINRSTFYANYMDIYDLVEKIGNKMVDNLLELYKDEREKNYNSNNYLKLFKDIKENQIFYKTYFKLGLDNDIIINEYDTELASKYYNGKYIDYHITFFRAGLNAILKKWLDSGCKESPEEIKQILEDEYDKK